MGVMLDTSALIGLHEADAEVATYLAGVLEQHDDGTVPKTHQVVLGELWTGVLASGEMHDPDNPRRPVLDTASASTSKPSKRTTQACSPGSPGQPTGR